MLRRLKDSIIGLFAFKAVKVRVIIEKLERAHHPRNSYWVQWKRGGSAVNTVTLRFPKIPRRLTQADAMKVGSSLFGTVNFPSLRKLDTQYRVMFSYLGYDYSLVVDVDGSVRLVRFGETRRSAMDRLKALYWRIYRWYVLR